MADADRLNWRAVNRLLDELLEMPQAAREARLVQVAKEDPWCAKEAAALLSHQLTVERDQFLDDAPIRGDDLRTLTGQRIGEYVLDRQIGAGGMGAVWLAHGADAHGHVKVAIKFLNLYQLGDAALECLRREARALARLSHANITRLIDARLASGHPYLVLEYVDGKPIDVWCDARLLDVAGRVRLFLQVLDAVSHAHGRLILHRDLKPSNVLVTNEGAVKLLDFGIAKLIESTGLAQPESQVTLLLSQALTPEYSAPEQIRRGEVTVASDVYSLGVLLYSLLAGLHPTPSMRAATFMQMRAAMEDEPQRASQAALQADWTTAPARGMSPQEISRELRGDLDNILAKALKRNPAERYPTVDAFADDLHRYLSCESVSARGDSRSYRLRKFARRYRRAIVAAVTALAIATSAAVAAWHAVDARRARAQAQAQQEEARYQAQRADVTHELLSVLLTLDSASEMPSIGSDWLDVAIELIETRYGASSAFAGRMFVELATQSRDSRPTRASELFERGYEIGRGAGDDELMALARCASIVGEASAGAIAVSEKLAEAQRLLGRVRAPGIDVRVACLQASAWRASTSGDHSTGLVELNKARTLLEDTGNTHRASYVTTLKMLESVHQLAPAADA